jgi:multiple sugar transport system ATP-binding protein
VAASGVDEVVVGVRPEALRFDTADGIPALVSVVESLGHERHVVCRLDDHQLVIVRQDAHEPAPAEESSTFLVADPGSLHVFDPSSGDRLSA